MRSIDFFGDLVRWLVASHRTASLVVGTVFSHSTATFPPHAFTHNVSYLGGNRRPIDTMIRLLTRYFNPDKIEPGYSLAIGGAAEPSDSSSSSSSGGGGGAGDGAATKKGPRLTHSHARQFHFVLQSLMLWRAVTHDMFRLWVLAEQDLLDQSQGNAYKLTDTGQGMSTRLACAYINRSAALVGTEFNS